MNGIEGFILGWIIGIITTYAGIMAFTHYMTKKEKKAYIKAYKEKKGIKNNEN